MRILELFAGSCSIGKVAELRGHEVFSIDIEDFEGIDLVKDIEFLQPSDIPWVPDMIWASPPCTTYSISAISHHRRGQLPISEFAKKSDRLVKNTLAIFRHFGCIFYMENPRGMLRKMDFMKGLDMTTLCYCRYQDTRMKPTDVFSNNIRNLHNPYGWEARPMCFNGNINCHHEPAPRGSKTGTQGLKDNYARSIIPSELCVEIIKATEMRYNNAKSL